MPMNEHAGIDFEPLWDYLLIYPQKPADTTHGGLHLPGGVKLDNIALGLVIKAGSGAYRESGAFIENPIKAGMMVHMMANRAPFSLTHNGKNYLVMAGRDVVAIAPKASNDIANNTKPDEAYTM